MSHRTESSSQWARLVESYYEAWFRYHPEAAVDVGAFDYADRLAPASEEARGALVCLNDELRTSLEELDSDALSPDEQLDFDLLDAAAQLENQFLLDIEPHRPDPERLLPVNAIHQLTIRPVPDFAGALSARLKAVPAALAEAREFLTPRAVGIPPLWIESAVTEARQGARFFESLPRHPRVAQGPGIAGLEMVLHKATQALHDYADFLEVELAPKATGRLGCGEEYFQSLLHKRHGLAVTVEELAGLGEELVAHAQEQLIEACRALTGDTDIAVALKQLHAQHPAPEELLAVYRAQMEQAREFVGREGLVSVPARQQLDIVETPVFLRHQIPFAAYCEPAPNDPHQQGFYYVTPPQTPEELGAHDVASIMHTCVHEAWPGHHLQFVTANQNPAARTWPRLLNASATFYEGWALYSEQLMSEKGFLAGPAQQFILLRDFLWRAQRILIDIDLHTRGASVDECVQRLVTSLGFTRSQAMAEIVWYSRAPTVPLSYATGWSLINALRDWYEQSQTPASLKDFHDRLLSAGSVALPRAIQRVFGQPVWEKVRERVFGDNADAAA